ncbi:MAG: hypothetical protein NTX49_04745, partial [Chlamydiae bacterium]|nr:hypothetical protein [Chlamydiota bacterium]
GSPILALLEKEKAASEKAGEDSPLKLNYRLHYLMALYVATESNRLGAPGADGAPAGVDIIAQSTLEKLIALRSRPLQIYLTSILPKVTRNTHLLIHYNSLMQAGGTKKEHIGFEYARPILLALASWSQGIIDDDFDAAKSMIRGAIQANQTQIKDAKTGLNIACLTTLKALDSSPLSPKDKLHLFTEICRANPTKADAAHFEKSLKYLQLLCEMGFFSKVLPDSFRGEITFEALENTAMDQAKIALFGKEAIDPTLNALLQAKYLELGAAQRRPLALELYARRIRSLEHAGLNKELSRFITSVLNGSFPSERYDASLSSHLEMIQKNFPTLWSVWQLLPPAKELNYVREVGGRAPAGVAAQAAVEASPLQERDSYQWLKQKLITDRHFDSAGTLPLEITSFLSDESMFVDAESLVSTLSPESSYTEMQKLILRLCKKEISLGETISVLVQLQTLVAKDPMISGSQWKRDIDDRIQLLSVKQKEITFEVLLTDNWQDLFLSGSEVLGSCQSIDGDLDKNKCLLAYCLDGKIQMAAVRDKQTGKIVSRALLKLLLREEGGKLIPSLFLERIYPSPCPKDQEDALNELAIQRARDLGIELYTHNPDLPKAGELASLQSLSSPCPFEYEDGGVGVSANGVYTIRDALRVKV